MRVDNSGGGYKGQNKEKVYKNIGSETLLLPVIHYFLFCFIY